MNSVSLAPYPKLLHAGVPPLQACSQSAWCPATRGIVLGGRLYDAVQFEREQARHAGPARAGEDAFLSHEHEAVLAVAEPLLRIVRIEPDGCGRPETVVVPVEGEGPPVSLGAEAVGHVGGCPHRIRIQELRARLHRQRRVEASALNAGSKWCVPMSGMVPLPKSHT